MRSEIKPVPDEYDELWMLLYQVVTGLGKAAENEARPLGVSALQGGVLFALKATDGPATTTQISQWLFRERHSVSELLSRMEKQGLVKRVRSRSKSGMVDVALTRKGERIFSQYNEERKIIRKILSCLSLEERASLRIHLEKLRESALEQLPVRPRLPFP